MNWASHWFKENTNWQVSKELRTALKEYIQNHFGYCPTSLNFVEITATRASIQLFRHRYVPSKQAPGSYIILTVNIEGKVDVALFSGDLSKPQSSLSCVGLQCEADLPPTKLMRAKATYESVFHKWMKRPVGWSVDLEVLFKIVNEATDDDFVVGISTRVPELPGLGDDCYYPSNMIGVMSALTWVRATLMAFNEAAGFLDAGIDVAGIDVALFCGDERIMTFSRDFAQFQVNNSRVRVNK